MAKEPEDRFMTARDLVEDASSALGLSGEFAAPASVRARSRRRLVLIVALVAVLVAVAVVVPAVLLTGGGDEAVAGEQWSRVPHDEAVFGGFSSDSSARRVVAGESGLLVAVGSDGSFAGQQDDPDDAADAVIWTSLDGVAWRRASDFNTPGNESAVDVMAHAGGFVVVGADFVAGSVLVWTSQDGESWRVATIGQGGFAGGVTVGGPGFVAVGSGSADLGAIWTSPDAETWTEIEPDPDVFGSRLPGFVGGWLWDVVAAPDGRVVAVGFNSRQEGPLGFGRNRIGTAFLSPDGVTWTRVPHDPAVFGDESGTVDIQAVTAGGPGFVAVGVEAERAPDGFYNGVEDWFADDPSILDGRLLAQGTRGAVWTSPGGLAWSRVSDEQLPDQGEGNTRLLDVSVGGPGLVAVGWRRIDAALEPVVWTSEDGTAWSRATEIEAAAQESGGQVMRGVTDGGPGLVAVGADGSERGHTPSIWTSP